MKALAFKTFCVIQYALYYSVSFWDSQRRIYKNLNDFPSNTIVLVSSVGNATIVRVSLATLIVMVAKKK